MYRWRYQRDIVNFEGVLNMDQKERLDYLVQYLCQDSIVYKDIVVKDEQKRQLLRSLMNIRMPKPASKKFIQIQDEFLQEEAVEKGIVKTDDLPTVKEMLNVQFPFADRICLWKGDITRLKADAIVNAANSQMLGCFVPCHRCIDNAIHSSAGIQLRAECMEYMEEQRKNYGEDYEEPTGQAVITSAYNLPSRYVIHTVGPIVKEKLTQKECNLLNKCYQSCLEVAERKGLKSIVFCCISTGEFGFPNKEAAQIAVETVVEFLQNSQKIERVIFDVFKDEDFKIYQKSLELKEIKSRLTSKEKK